MKVKDRYGFLDRLLHRLAFRLGFAQQVLSDLEEILYAGDLRSLPATRPVFITALPRSGTTILLKILHRVDPFACHLYRDMPFVLCPMLWNRFTHLFGSDDVPRERIHGDGLTVSSRSPEAFEEMIWKYFWSEHYREDRIQPWDSEDSSDEFNRFFETHMRKIVALRRGKADGAGRYLSKNNLNLARLAAPPEPLRRGTFLIPFREPLQHAASMFRQHQRFLSIHEQDDFVRVYMEAIGHHEFGMGLRPVNFGGWLEEAPDPGGLAFWVRYWCAAYRFVLEHAGDSTVLASYARLTEQPARALSRLARAVDVPAGALIDQAERLHPPRTHEVHSGSLPDSLVETASKLHDRLRRRALV